MSVTCSMHRGSWLGAAIRGLAVCILATFILLMWHKDFVHYCSAVVAKLMHNFFGLSISLRCPVVTAERSMLSYDSGVELFGTHFAGGSSEVVSCFHVLIYLISYSYLIRVAHDIYCIVLLQSPPLYFCNLWVMSQEQASYVVVTFEAHACSSSSQLTGSTMAIHKSNFSCNYRRKIF